MVTDREILQQKIRDTPKRVFQAFYLAALLGVLLGLRGILLRMIAGTFSGKSLFFTLIIVAFFVFNGVSLLTRSRIAYVLLAVFALPPVLGSLVGATHLLALLVTGEIASNPIDTIASIVATLQLVVIAALYFTLFASTTRSYVWHTPASAAASQ